MTDWLVESLRNFEYEEGDFEPIFVTPWTGKKHTEESKKAIGDALRGKIHTEQSRKNMSHAHKGMTFTEEWVKNRTNSYCSKHQYTITKSGEVEIVNNLNNWCKENNLPQTSVQRHLQNGTSYKGYTFSREVVK